MGENAGKMMAWIIVCECGRGQRLGANAPRLMERARNYRERIEWFFQRSTQIC